MSYHHLALLVLINVLWGLNFIAGKIGTDVFGPLWFSTVRFAVVLILLFPFLRWAGGQMRVILLIGLCLGAGHYSIMFYALHLGDNVSTIAIAAQLTVPFSTLCAIVFLGESIGAIRIIAIAMSFLGIVVIGFEPVGPEHVLALFAATVAAAVMAVAAILMRRLEDVGVFNLQAWIAVVSTVVLALLTWSIERPTQAFLTSIPVFDYWTPVYSAIGATIIGHGSLYYLLQRHPVSHVTPFITLATLFAIGFGVTLLDDVLTPKIIVGGLFTLLGVTIIAHRNATQGGRADEPTTAEEGAHTPTGIRVPR